MVIWVVTSLDVLFGSKRGNLGTSRKVGVQQADINREVNYFSHLFTMVVSWFSGIQSIRDNLLQS